jgi:hypothetical protein
MKDITIKEIIQQYLEKQEDRVQPDSYKQYRDTLASFQHYLNKFGPDILSNEEEKEFDQKTTIDAGVGKSKVFTEIYGVEMLERIGWSGFLIDYVPHKIMIVTKSDVKQIARVLRNFIKWLVEKQYITQELFESTREEITDFKEYNEDGIQDRDDIDDF